MTGLESIFKLPLELSIRLAQNEDFQRLLVVDSPNPATAEFTKRSWDELVNEGYMDIAPVMFKDGVTQSGVNTFACVLLDDMSFYNTDNHIYVSGRIHLGTTSNLQRLHNNELRLLKMAGEVKKTLDDHKFSASGKLEITSISSIAYSESVFGYVINFRTKEQEERTVDI